MRADFDLVVIGGGAAGLVSAAGAAGLGARVALIERHRLGGECLWTGCVPSKALLACARVAADAQHGARYGVLADNVRIDFTRVMQHVHSAQQTIAPHDSPERFRSLGVDVIEAEARFIGERTLRADGRELTGRHVIIATGSRPAIPAVPGLADVPFLTNESIFTLTTQPASLVVLGGGAIGTELAHAFALLGTHVTLIEAAPRLLMHEDAELADMLAAELRNAGVTLHLNTAVSRVERMGSGVRLHTGAEVIEVETLLVATGRESVFDTLDAAAGGVETRGHELIVDEKLRTTARNVWAAGDVTGGPRFTHVADYQARTILRNAFFPLTTNVNYDVVPRVTYTQPELAGVGLTEAAARERFGDRVRIWTRRFSELDRAIADGRTAGMLKIVADEKGHIIGGHVLGQHAGSIIAEITLAMREKVPLSRLSATLHAYPTYAEAVKQSADAYMRSRFAGFARTAANWLVRRM